MAEDLDEVQLPPLLLPPTQVTLSTKFVDFRRRRRRRVRQVGGVGELGGQQAVLLDGLLVQVGYGNLAREGLRRVTQNTFVRIAEHVFIVKLSSGRAPERRIPLRRKKSTFNRHLTYPKLT